MYTGIIGGGWLVVSEEKMRRCCSCQGGIYQGQSCEEFHVVVSQIQILTERDSPFAVVVVQGRIGDVHGQSLYLRDPCTLFLSSNYY